MHGQKERAPKAQHSPGHFWPRVMHRALPSSCQMILLQQRPKGPSCSWQTRERVSPVTNASAIGLTCRRYDARITFRAGARPFYNGVAANIGHYFRPATHSTLSAATAGCVELM